jgi:Fur family ferric uptake transcriptional regulator
MSCQEEAATALRRAGHKATPQRLLVISALRHTGGHVTAGAIADIVRRENPAVDVSTIYRTLDILTRAKLATSTDMGTGDALYEWAASEEPHHHLICVRCGPVAALPHGYLSQLESQLEDEFDFAPDLGHFAIFGTCGACQKSSEDDA